MRLDNNKSFCYRLYASWQPIKLKISTERPPASSLQTPDHRTRSPLACRDNLGVNGCWALVISMGTYGYRTVALRSSG
eukprot:scaffold447690_cov50-Prasinocladus_malaysianus.AAC.1